MLFILGIIVGLLNSILVFTILSYYRQLVENKVEVVKKQLELKGPRPKGFIHMPESEAEIVRKQIIENNKKEGRDTPISELL